MSRTPFAGMHIIPHLRAWWTIGQFLTQCPVSLWCSAQTNRASLQQLHSCYTVSLPVSYPLLHPSDNRADRRAAV